MISTDSDIFIIDLLIKNDKRFATNKSFLDNTKELSTSIFNVLEVCGICSFQYNEKDLIKLFEKFSDSYKIDILFPKRSEIELLTDECLSRIKRKMNFEDALILWVAEENFAEYFITWNKKHFEGRTEMRVLTPKEYLELQKKVNG